MELQGMEMKAGSVNPMSLKDVTTFQMLDEALDNLERLINDVEIKFSPVLRTDFPSQNNPSDRPEPSSAFRARVEKLTSLNGSLFSLIDRADL